MDHAYAHPGRLASDGTEGTAFAFAAFVMAHAECAGEIVEFRLRENAMACWCPRCDEVGAFGPAD